MALLRFGTTAAFVRFAHRASRGPWARFAFAILLIASPVAARPLTVDDAVRLALEANPRFRAAEERAEGASDQARSARGRIGFNVIASEEYQHWNCNFDISFSSFKAGCPEQLPSMIPPGSPPGTMFMPPFPVRSQDTSSFALIATQPILGLGRIIEEYKSQQGNAHAAHAGVKAGAAAVREAVKNGFLRTFEARALEQIAHSSVEELAEQVRVAQARLKAGVITNADLLRVSVAEANAKQQQIVAHSQADIARARLLEAIGLDPDDRAYELIEPSELLESSSRPLPEAGSLKGASQRRPEVAQSRFVLTSAVHSRNARAWSMLPEINLDGGYLRIDGQAFAPLNSAYVGVKAQWALWEWGATWYQQRASARNARAAEFDLAAQKRAADVDAVTKWDEAQAAAAAVDVAQQTIASAEEAYRVTRALLQAGTATTTDLLDAQSALTTARLNLARAQYERAVARVSLARAMAE
jgi:outer membrane protein TolC